LDNYSLYVLTMRNAERVSSIEQQLSELSLQFSFIDATVYKGSEVSESVSIAENVVKERNGRFLTNGEIGCFLSHRGIWATILTENKNGVIFEDDALVDNRIVDFLGRLTDSDLEFDVVLLGHSKKDPRKRKLYHFLEPLKKSEKLGPFLLGRGFKTWPSGAVGYVVTPRGAERLLKASEKIQSVLDDWPLFESQGVVVKEVRPLLVWEDFINMQSALEDDRKTPSRKKIYFTARLIRGVIRNVVSKLG